MANPFDPLSSHPPDSAVSGSAVRDESSYLLKVRGIPFSVSFEAVAKQWRTLYPGQLLLAFLLHHDSTGAAHSKKVLLK